MSDLLDLQNYLQKKHNIKVQITKLNNKKSIININNVLYNLIIIIILLIFIIILYITILKISKKKNNFIIHSFFLFIIIFNLFYVFNYIFMILIYSKNKNYINKYKINNEIKKIDKKYYENLKTGDILQSPFFWNSDMAWLLYIIPIDYLHNIFVINFKNKKYGLHYINNTFGYPENILSFNNKHIEIFYLDDYFFENYESSKYYRIFQVKKEINNDNVFGLINKLNKKDIKFTFLPSFKKKDDTDFLYYNCLSFILKILNHCYIIPNMNYRNFSPNDLIYLPKISNYFYNDPIMIQVEKNN